MTMLVIQSDKQRGPRAQSGVALAMLLWFIAAMSILVAGIVSQSKTDVKLAQLQLQQLQTEAAADGAVLLLLRDLTILQGNDEFPGRGIFEQVYTLGEHDVRIRAVPVTGLVDLNLASEGLIMGLFQYGAMLDEEQAASLSLSFLEWRGDAEFDETEIASEDVDIEQEDIRTGRFEVIEDLLRVEGINRDIYDRIVPFIYVAQKGLEGIDPLSSPDEVLMLLGADREQLAEIGAKRRENPFDDSVFGSVLNDEYTVIDTLPLFRLDARVKFSDGKIYQRTRWVELGGYGMNGLPWRIMRSEPVVAVSSEDFSMLEFDDVRH